MSHSISNELSRVFSTRSDAVLMLDVRSGNSHTYESALSASLRLATYLVQQGMGKHASVAVSMDNCMELALLYLACMHLGMPVVPLNPKLSPGEFAHLVRRSTVHSVFLSPTTRHRFQGALFQENDVDAVCLVPSVETASIHRLPDDIEFASIITSHQPRERKFDALDSDVLLRMPTSGTSGTPKILNLTWDNLFSSGRMFATAMGIDEENRFYDFIPMTYLGGIYNLFIIPMFRGASLAVNSAFGGAMMYGIWEDVREYEINTLWFTAAMLSMLLDIDDGEDVSFLKDSIRLGLVGMAPLASETKKRFETRFGFALHENYALSETLFITSERPGSARKDGGSGTALPDVRVEIVGDSGTPLACGMEGEIKVTSPYRIPEYHLAGVEDMERLLPEGGMLTGDLGFLDGEGELFVTGRAKDLIIRGGLNISPRQIENVLTQHPRVAEAVVVGIPDKTYGEEIEAAVVLFGVGEEKTTESDLLVFCSKNLAEFQRPKKIHIMRNLPKGATGKILKRELREILLQSRKSCS